MINTLNTTQTQYPVEPLFFSISMIIENNCSLCSSLNREILVSGHEGSCKVFSTEDVLVNNGLFGSRFTNLLNKNIVKCCTQISFFISTVCTINPQVFSFFC